MAQGDGCCPIALQKQLRESKYIYKHKPLNKYSRKALTTYTNCARKRSDPKNTITKEQHPCLLYCTGDKQTVLRGCSVV